MSTNTARERCSGKASFWMFQVVKMEAKEESSVSNAKRCRTCASSSRVARVREKAEAAKVRASHANQEAKLKMGKATEEAQTHKQVLKKANLNQKWLKFTWAPLTLHMLASSVIIERYTLIKCYVLYHYVAVSFCCSIIVASFVDT